LNKYKLILFSRIKHRVYEIIMLLVSLLYNDKKGIKVIIFGQGRSGSTLLESLIDSTRYFEKKGELLNNKKTEKWFPYHFVNGLSKIDKADNFIFHLKIYHLTSEREKEKDPKEFIRKAVNDGWKIIYLHRDNKIRQAISNLVAEQRGGFHKHNKSKEEINITIDINRFEKMVDRRFDYTQEELSILSEIPHFKINYEQDLMDNSRHEEVVAGLLQFLGLENDGVAPKTTHKKVNTSTLKDLILNYSEFNKLLEKNGWLHFIEDEPI